MGAPTHHLALCPFMQPQIAEQSIWIFSLRAAHHNTVPCDLTWLHSLSPSLMVWGSNPWLEEHLNWSFNLYSFQPLKGSVTACWFLDVPGDNQCLSLALEAPSHFLTGIVSTTYYMAAAPRQTFVHHLLRWTSRELPSQFTSCQRSEVVIVHCAKVPWSGYPLCGISCDHYPEVISGIDHQVFVLLHTNSPHHMRHIPGFPQLWGMEFPSLFLHDPPCNVTQTNPDTLIVPPDIHSTHSGAPAPCCVWLGPPWSDMW